MEGHGIKVEWTEGVAGCEGSTMLLIESVLGAIVFNPGQASVLIAEISSRPKLLEGFMFKNRPFLVGKGDPSVQGN